MTRCGKHSRDVEHAGDGPQQLGGAFDLRRTLTVGPRLAGLLGQLLVGKPMSEPVGELLCVKQVARRICIGVPGQQHKRPDNSLLDPDGDLQAALHATVRFRDHIEYVRLVVVENRCW